ncbi:MAG: DNA replication/repair protein RecF [Lachnospiraceae bacterium]|nr:DNA replication/repair protein RecF [Lachnospiraceae bacterium]
MIIQGLELQSFRNYETLSVSFDDHINILYGDNAQGKTNILEAIFVACTTKSHKRSKDREMVRFGDEEAHIRLHLLKKDISYRIDMHLKKQRKKSAALNGIPIRRASELLGIANVVFFSPEDLNIIKNGPSERRRFIDMELCQLDKVYLSDLTGYNRCLDQRNKLLKDMKDAYYRGNFDKASLEIWDEQLSSYGERVIGRRKRFIEELNEIIVKEHSQLTGGKENIILHYEPDEDENSLAEKLKKSRDRDFQAGATTAGPHRDDIAFSLDNVDLRKYGSQGQHRTASLSLKLSEIELVKREIHDSPILLLDDVLSELDKNRQDYLLQSIGDIQTVITCTGLDEFVRNRFSLNKVFFVKEGTIVSKGVESE